MAAREVAERAERAERLRLADEQRRREREERLADREAAERSERERRDHEALLAREQREHEARIQREEREENARREAAEREERTRREAAERAERERREREMSERERREREERLAHEQRERQYAERARQELLSMGPATERLPEGRARAIVQAAFDAGLPQRSAVELTGWSAGWIAARYQEAREHQAKTGGAPTPGLRVAPAPAQGADSNEMTTGPTHAALGELEEIAS